MRLFGLDVGEKRIGVAISDPLGIIAQGLTTITRQGDGSEYELIQRLISDNQVGKLIIGLPLNMNGSRGPSADKVSAFGERIKQLTGIPIILWDERLTTYQVEKHLLFADLSRQKRKKIIDMLSAQVILQSFLDSRKEG